MKEVFIYIFVLLILLLTSVNINNFLETKDEVLGITDQDTNKELWQDFVEKHPDYIPGWIELGDLNKIKEINPNYEIVISD